MIEFNIVGERLAVWSTHDAFIEESQRLMATGEQRVPNFLDLIDGTDCDGQWSWHVDAHQMEWADMTIELCDGRPSDIEKDKAYWLGTVGQYCPWDAQVVAVDDRR